MSDDKILKVNPILEKLAEVAERDSVVELQGYVGPSEPDVIRLHQSLSMTHYVEIPKDSILHAVETKDDDTGRVKLWVQASVRVTEVRVRHIDAKDVLGEIPPEIPPIREHPWPDGRVIALTRNEARKRIIAWANWFINQGYGTLDCSRSGPSTVTQSCCRAWNRLINAIRDGGNEFDEANNVLDMCGYMG